MPKWKYFLKSIEEVLFYIVNSPLYFIDKYVYIDELIDRLVVSKW